MATKGKTKLQRIREREEKVERERQRIAEEIENMIAPSRRKIVRVCEERVDALLRDRLDELESMTFSKDVIGEAIEEAVRRTLFDTEDEAADDTNEGEIMEVFRARRYYDRID